MAEPLSTRNTTIYDIAAEIGVAPSTVSRALTNPGRVSARTAERVWQVADRLDYRHRTVTPRVREASTGVLAVMGFDLERRFCLQMAGHVARYAGQHQWDVIVVDGQGDAARERPVVERVLALADGIVLISPRMSESAVSALARTKPTVVINRIVRGVASVTPDSEAGMAAAVDHLYGLGHRSISFLSGPVAARVSDLRRRALADRCRSLGVTLRHTERQRGTLENGQLAARSWRDSPTSAVVGFNDELAAGFQLAVQSWGFSVPQDVSVVGIDNTVLAQATGLTSVGFEEDALAAVAVDTLLDMMRPEFEPGTPRIHTVPMNLVVRGSTGPAPE